MNPHIPAGTVIPGPSSAMSPAPPLTPPTTNIPAVPLATTAPAITVGTVQYQVVAVCITYYINPASLKVTLWPVNHRVPLTLEDCVTIFVDPATHLEWPIGRIVSITLA